MSGMSCGHRGNPAASLRVHACYGTPVLLSGLEEVRLVIEEIVLSQKRVVDLLPRTSAVRRVQHEIVSHYHLNSISIGEEPNRYIRIYP